MHTFNLNDCTSDFLENRTLEAEQIWGKARDAWSPREWGVFRESVSRWSDYFCAQEKFARNVIEGRMNTPARRGRPRGPFLLKKKPRNPRRSISMLTRTGWANLSPSYRASWFEYQKDILARDSVDLRPLTNHQAADFFLRDYYQRSEKIKGEKKPPEFILKKEVLALEKSYSKSKKLSQKT